MLSTCSAQVRNKISMSVREKDKVFVSVLVGITLNQLEEVLTIFLWVDYVINIHAFFVGI